MKHELLEQTYHDLFDEHKEEYNKKQVEKGHPERQIKTSYLEKIRNDNRKNVAYEIIIQIGDRNTTSNHGNAEIEIMKKYLKDFEERNTSIHVFGAYIHRDEATIHMHIDYIPTGHMNKGMKVQNSLKKCLYELGFSTKKNKGTAQKQWTQNERKQLEKICHEHNIFIEHKKENREHLEKKQYILLSQNRELEKENRELLDKLDKKEREYREIENSEIKPFTPSRTITGKKIVDFAKYKASIDKANSTIYELKQEINRWKNKALSHANTCEELGKSLKEQNHRYIERDIETEKLREILETSQTPKIEYEKWKKEYESDIDKQNRDITYNGR